MARDTLSLLEIIARMEDERDAQAERIVALEAIVRSVIEHDQWASDNAGVAKGDPGLIRQFAAEADRRWVELAAQARALLDASVEPTGSPEPA